MNNLIENNIISNVSKKLGNLDFLLYGYLKQNYIWEEANITDSFPIKGINNTLNNSVGNRYNEFK